MPTYEFHCDACDKDVSLAMSMREHELGTAVCADCGGRLRPLLGTFFAQTSKKS